MPMIELVESISWKQHGRDDNDDDF